MGRKGIGDQVRGPYPDRARGTWFLQHSVGGKWSKSGEYSTEAAAQKARKGAESELAASLETTVEQGLWLYRDGYLIPVMKNKPESVATTMWRIGQFFFDHMKSPVRVLATPGLTQECRAGRWKMVKGEPKPKCVKDGISTRKLPRTGEPASVTSQIEMCDAARAFLNYLVREGYLKENPMSWYDPKREPAKEKGGIGRSDLTWTHASKVLLLAQGTAEKEAGLTELGTRAAAVFIAMTTAVRATSITTIKVQDVEKREGMPWILWVWKAKKRGERRRTRIDLDASFEPILGPLTEGRFGGEWLFAVSSPRHGEGLSREMKAELAGKYSALEQAKTKTATEVRRAWLREHGLSRQQLNKWQRGEWRVSAEPQRAKGMGKHWRDWVAASVGKFCVLAGGPIATAHELRGILATELTAQGYDSVAQWLLGHARMATTKGSYASEGSAGLGEQRKIFRSLKGGKKP